MSSVGVLVNGVAVDTISVHDRGFQYGDGLFETIAVHRGTPLLWEQHAQRLLAGAVCLDMPPPEAALLRVEADRLCRGIERGVLKIILTRGVSGRGYRPGASAPTTRVLSLSPWPDYPPSWIWEGVAVRLCQTRLASQPRLAGLKHLNRLEQVLARAEWGDEYAEGLMQDESGNIVEGTMTNIFLVEGATLRTPDMTRCGVEGVMRGAVLEQAERLGIACHIGPVTATQLEHAGELFLTNSLIGLWPVRRIENRSYTIGQTTRKIQQAIRDAGCAA
ncbi:MAG: aminodeoxychorismate lyase [Gammaproteobacteria bacterium]|nr:aminodeoxychorismate lyase [Gammaproteobacteria bacterium]